MNAGLLGNHSQVDRERARRKGREMKMSRLCREEPPREGQPSSRAGKFSIGGRVHQVRTEGCWENLEARSALVCKCAPQLLVPGLKPNRKLPQTDSRATGVTFTVIRVSAGRSCLNCLRCSLVS